MKRQNCRKFRKAGFYRDELARNWALVVFKMALLGMHYTIFPTYYYLDSRKRAESSFQVSLVFYEN